MVELSVSLLLARCRSFYNRRRELKHEKVHRFCVHILTGDDAKVGDIGVHLLLDDGGTRDTLPNTDIKVGSSSDKRMK